MASTDSLDRRAVALASQYMAMIAWPTVVLGVLLPASYLVVVAMALGGFMALWLAVPLVALITYLSYTVLHESAHGSIAGKNRSLRWLNKALGYVAAWVTMIPLTAHRHEHMAHHRHANDPAGDPDFHVGAMSRSLLAPLHVALRAWISQFSYYLRYRWADAPPRQNLCLCLEVAAALLPRLAVLLAGYWVEGLVLFVLAWLLGAILLLYLFAYIVHRPHDQVGRYRDTSTILVTGWVRTFNDWAWMYQNYHAIHHLFPRVPFYKYAELYEEIEDIMSAKGAPVYRLRWRGLESRISDTGRLPEPAD